jgi:hypothetical protein
MHHHMSIGEAVNQPSNVALERTASTQRTLDVRGKLLKPAAEFLGDSSDEANALVEKVRTMGAR